jgi:hypothetical protein
MTVQPPDYDALVKQSGDEIESTGGFKAGLVVSPAVGAILGGIVGVVTTHGPAGVAGAVPGAAIGFAIPWIYAAIRSRQVAKQRFFVAWAQQHGLAYEPHPPVYHDTPLLRAGDAQYAHNAFAGALAGLQGSVYQHTKRVRHTSTDSKGNTTTTNEDTDYVVLRLAFSLPGFRRLELHPRSFGDFRMFDGIESSLTANRVVELESEELAHDFKLEVDDGVDEVTLRRLFTPEAIVQVLDSRSNRAFRGGVTLELEGSTLVFFRQGPLSPRSIGVVDALVAAATPYVQWLGAFAAQGQRA